MFGKLKVRNFGPIQSGYGDNGGFIDFSLVTLFCGPQGSGKSTITKLYSTLTWLEKCVFREFDFAVNEAIFRESLAWQGLEAYLSKDSEIEFVGELLRLQYVNGVLACSTNTTAERDYLKPKISYMPAERNFASIVQNAIGVGNLPPPLLDMQAEFEKAKKFYASQYKLPVGSFAFEYDSGRKESWIVNDGSVGKVKTKLETASSGLQSMLPMLLVSDYLSTTIISENNNKGNVIFHDPGTPERKLKNEDTIRRVLASKLSEEEKEERLERFFSPGRSFVNIVEEPEQNLYPDAQYAVVKRLLTLANLYPGNRLVLSTHSPFVVNTMVMASVSDKLYSMLDKSMEPSVNMEYAARLGNIWQRSCSLGQDKMALYELDGGGSVSKLDVEGGVFSDANKLNAFLEVWNDDFDELLSIEEELHG